MDQPLQGEWEPQLCLPIADPVPSYNLLLVLLQVRQKYYTEIGNVLKIHVL
jgi:hypothetical protein